VLEERENHLEGEVIISADTAAVSAAEIGWPSRAELLLYAIHGTLHLVGYRDETIAESEAMRAAEAAFLRMFGFEQPSDHGSSRSAGGTASERFHDGASAQ
jgi:probable rRNA maturation factor